MAVAYPLEVTRPMHRNSGERGDVSAELSVGLRVSVQAQAEQHANELLNQWEHAKKGLIAASG